MIIIVNYNKPDFLAVQIPLILSWAITIHKAQGMSLDYVRTDIGNSIFEYGQAYVVLSRIKNIEGLSLININYGSIKAHPKVLEYYSKL
jgi:ATP-dependent DNA helicase PIF1